MPEITSEKDVSSVTEKTVTSTETSSSLVIAHLHTYPCLNAACNYASTLSVVQQLNTRAQPYVDATVKNAPAVSTRVLKHADQLGDRVLTSVDNVFPALKTTQPEQVVELAKKNIEILRSTAVAYGTAAQERVVRPLVTRSGPVVDPLLKPVNERVAGMLNTYLPGENTAEEVSEGATAKEENELSRSVQLAVTAVKRAKPVLDSTAATTKAHVQAVYDSKLAEYTKEGSSDKTSKVYASLATCRQLSSEGITYAGTVLQPSTSN